jgi:hypothetical protein
MKNIQMITVGILTLASCNQTAKPPTFLPGVYLNEAENEFCKITDTLSIRKTSQGSATYEITRRACFQRVKEGKSMPAEYQVDQWLANYDESQGSLVSLQKSDPIQYLPKENKITKSGFIYEKIE